MIKLFISTAFFLVITLLGYNYFFGTAEEKQQAQEIFSKGTEIIGAGADLLKSEYEKYEDGKYDEALDNITNLLGEFKDQDGDLSDEINRWEERKNDWNAKKSELQKLLDPALESLDNEQIRRILSELEEERVFLEEEGNRLKEKAE